jgi:hypothetical protein
MIPETGPSGPAATAATDVFGRVRSIIDPQLQAAADIINRRSQMGSSAITGLTSSLGGMAGAYGADVQKAYGPEINMWRGLSDWSQKQLAQSGAARQADLGAALAQSGVQGPADINLAQQGQGAGLAAYGTGIAQLDQYIASQAASQARAALEPSFAAGMGQQQQSLLASQLARQLGEQQSEIQARVPDLVAHIQEQDYARQQDERDYQLRIAQLGLEQGRWATEQQTGQQHWEAEQKRAEAEQSLAEREFGLRKTTTASELAARRAGLVGPNAPTVQGRMKHWQDIADKRTQMDPQGRVWVGTSSGIKPATDPKTGRPMRSSDWVKQQAGIIMATGIDPKTGLLTPAAQKKLAALGVTTGGGAEKYIKPTTGPAAVKLQHVRGADGKMYSFDPSTGQYFNAAGKAAIPGGAPPKQAKLPKVNVTLSRDRGQWVDSSGNPIPRLNQSGPPPPKPTGSTRTTKGPNAPLGTPTGNRPRRTRGGTWTYADGRKLPANVATIWEGYYQSGKTDGRGGLGPAKKKGSNTNLPRGVQ